MDNSEKIKALQSQIDSLKREQEEFNNLPKSAQIAEILHKKTCRNSHEDYCDFYYSSWNDPNSTKRQYQDKARSILSAVGDNVEIAMKVVNAM